MGFRQQHIHDAEEIRYILGGSGFFDVRDLQGMLTVALYEENLRVLACNAYPLTIRLLAVSLLDRWIRVWVKKGDLMTLPEGIYHRFTTDENRIIHAMRLFVGQPVWTPFNRPQEEHPSRKKYVEEFAAGDEKKEE